MLYSKSHTLVPRNGEGTNAEITRASRVAYLAAGLWRVGPDEFFVAGHTHEGLNPGGVSVYWPGDPEWTITFPTHPQAVELAAKMNAFFEPISGTILGVYPALD